MDEADTLCRDLAFIDRGKIVRRGTPAELKSGMGGDLITLEFAEGIEMEAVRAVVETVIPNGASHLEGAPKLIICAPDADALVPRLIQALDARQSTPKSLSITQPTLEDVFVQLVGHGIMDDESQLVQGRDPFIQARQT
jgi:ABC-2 type transport system ATP-binding protein